MNRNRLPVLALSALLLAALACNLPGQGNLDANATVAALSTAIRLTTAAQTQSAAGGAVRVATFTPALVTATPAPPPATDVLPSPTSELQRAGEILRAPRAGAPVTVDGDLSEWGSLPNSATSPAFGAAAVAGPADSSFNFALGWDAGYLYVAALVADDVHVQTQHGELIFKGDSLELLLDADLAGDFNSAQLNADDYQLGLSPGALTGDSPEAFLWFPAAKTGKPAGVVLAARAAGAGFSLEAAVPWSLIGLSPLGGQRFGFALSASDNDAAGTAQQQSMVSTAAGRRLADPATWGTLVLEP